MFLMEYKDKLISMSSPCSKGRVFHVQNIYINHKESCGSFKSIFVFLRAKFVLRCNRDTFVTRNLRSRFDV